MNILVASTRMYNVAPGATAAWHRLLHRVSADAGVPLQVVDHPHPATLDSLWQRPDLGCAFMCGWPLAKEQGQRPVIAAPVPLGEPGPRYHAVFVVQDASPFERLEETFGQSFAFNAQSSHSGWNMPQAYLAQVGGRFSAEIGPFGPHQRSVEAVAAGEAAVAAIDSLVWALLCRHAPALASTVRVVGRTPDQPCPPLVGSPALGQDEAERLRRALIGLAGGEPGRTLLEDVCLAGFAKASRGDYDETLTIGAAA
jgi:ABC-type phosphate/phosphonate transport system substrate-binding protein